MTKTRDLANAVNPGGLPAGNVEFIQSGTGAESRTVESKLRDLISVKDFGAVGDGVIDDTQAVINAVAAASGKTLLFPVGTYKIVSNISIDETVELVLDNGANFLVGIGVTVSIFGPVVTGHYPYWSGVGSVVSYAFEQTNQRMVIWQQPASPLSNADIYLSNIRDKMFQVIAFSQAPTSTSTVTAGTGLKTWTIQPGLRLADDLGINVWAHRDSDGLYMQGTIDSYNNATGQLTLNVFSNQLGSSTESNWYFTVASDTLSVFQYGGATKGASQGLYVQVASSSGPGRPYNSVIAAYGGSGTIPVIYAVPNGATGFGTEVPNQRVHVVGADGASDSGIRLTESLAENKGLTFYPHSGGYSVLSSYDWDATQPYSLRMSAKNFFQSDWSKTVAAGGSPSYANIATISLQTNGACHIEVVGGGDYNTQGGTFFRRTYFVTRNSGACTVTLQDDMPASSPYAGCFLEVLPSGNDVVVRAGASTHSWAANGFLVVKGQNTTSML